MRGPLTIQSAQWLRGSCFGGGGPYGGTQEGGDCEAVGEEKEGATQQ